MWPDLAFVQAEQNQDATMGLDRLDYARRIVNQSLQDLAAAERLTCGNPARRRTVRHDRRRPESGRFRKCTCDVDIYLYYSQLVAPQPLTALYIDSGLRGS
jgi:hypothetical protein